MSYQGINQQTPHSGRYVNENGELVNIADIMEYQIGGKGAEFISDTVTHSTTNVYTAIQIITDTTISSYTTDANAQITGNTLTGVLLQSGLTIYGRFTSITLASGSVIAYKGI